MFWTLGEMIIVQDRGNDIGVKGPGMEKKKMTGGSGGSKRREVCEKFETFPPVTSYYSAP